MIAEHKGEIPVVILLLPFMAGIAAGINYPSLSIIILAVPILLLSLAFVTLNLAYAKLKVYQFRWLGGLLLAPILFTSGWLLTMQHYQLNNTSHFSKSSAEYLVVHINSEPQIKADVVRFTADVVQTVHHNKPSPASGTLLIAIKDELATNLFYGEELLIPAKYTGVEPPHNPGEFNYKKYLAAKNIYHQTFLYPKQYRITKAGFGNPLIAYALKTRQNLVQKLRANMQDTTAIAVASTLILGYKAGLSNDVLQAYSKTGTIHILSVSGGHVALIYLLLAGLLRFRRGRPKGTIAKAIVIIALIWAYALLTGFSPAVNRASLMISMAICGQTFLRYVNMLNILACSAFVLLLYDPFLLTDVGFQLSYLAVAGLIIFQPIVSQWFTFKNRVSVYLWDASAVSISAQAITFPLSAYYFHQAPLYFLVSNLLILLPVGIIMYAGLVLLLLPQTPYLSRALGFVLEHTILLMNKALAYIEHLPYATIGKIWLNMPEHLLLYIIIMAAFYFLFNTKKKWALQLALISTLLFCISIGLKKARADKTRSVTFLSLRKHTGVVFKNGANGVVITDLPDTDKTFRYAVQPGLDSMRITNYNVIKPDSNLRLPWLIKKQSLVQFLDTRLLLLNQSSQLQSILPQFKIKYLYISGNPVIKLKQLHNQTLVLDGSNSDAYINGFRNISVKSIILKRNKSITITSNE